jgi:hypothetical protein
MDDLAENIEERAMRRRQTRRIKEDRKRKGDQEDLDRKAAEEARKQEEERIKVIMDQKDEERKAQEEKIKRREGRRKRRQERTLRLAEAQERLSYEEERQMKQPRNGLGYDRPYSEPRPKNAAFENTAFPSWRNSYSDDNDDVEFVIDPRFVVHEEPRKAKQEHYAKI